MTKFLIAVALMLAAVNSGRADDRTPAPNKPPLPPPVAPWSVAPYSEPRGYSSTGWYETPKQECELLPDQEEARLCVQYPQRESILNSAVLGLGAMRPAIARYKPDRRNTCPITVAPGELRAVICGKLAERYELYCCN